MPFEKVSKMSPKKEFVILASQPEANVSLLCQRFGISRPTGYKWLDRFAQEGETGLEERSRRPNHSPWKADDATEKLVLLIRDERPTWGARKIKRYLEGYGEVGLPSPSTITEILRRNGRLDSEGVAKKWRRFESEAPMGLLQMDFKGHFKTKFGRCHPLTLLDDHSRYLLELGACSNEKGDTVKTRLREVFRRYGLPRAIITDNGNPWGMAGQPKSLTDLALWLIRLGIELKRSAAYHPQTMGKIERMHRTLKAEVIQARQFGSLAECQRAFDEWREDYNFLRPHEAIGFQTPSQRFQLSDIPFPERMPEIEYSPDDMIRKVSKHGTISFKGRLWRVGMGLKGFPVAVREVEEGVYNAVFVRQILLRINFRDAPPGGASMGTCLDT
ncbi:MAG: IS481 family transposase [bacterium]|nr:IS481 family transposase [bacterium]